jgi:hypothetical protein
LAAKLIEELGHLSRNLSIAVLEAAQDPAVSDGPATQQENVNVEKL